MATEKMTYEAALKQLNEIVQQLERKEIKIDALSTTVEKAKQLVDFCREKLDKTEDDIKKIIADGEKE